MPTFKPRLIPLEVPWMVSPSTPFLKLHSPQTDRSMGTYVQFVAYNRLLDSDSAAATGKCVSIMDSLARFRPAASFERGAYQLVRLHFVNAVNSRMTPSFSDSQVIEESAYDWSNVPGAWQGEDIFAHLRKADAIWATTRICGDPGVYEVTTGDHVDETPSSVASTSKRPTTKRFLILGHDSFVEIVAERVEVQYGQVLVGW